MTQTIEGVETITFEQIVPYEEDKEEDRLLDDEIVNAHLDEVARNH